MKRVFSWEEYRKDNPNDKKPSESDWQLKYDNFEVERKGSIFTIVGTRYDVHKDWTILVE